MQPQQCNHSGYAQAEGCSVGGRCEEGQEGQEDRDVDRRARENQFWCKRCHLQRTLVPVRQHFSKTIPTEGDICKECKAPYLTIACVIFRDDWVNCKQRTHIFGTLLKRPLPFHVISMLVKNECHSRSDSPSLPDTVETVCQYGFPNLSFNGWTNALFGKDKEALRPPFEVSIKQGDNGIIVMAAITLRALSEWWDVYNYLVIQGVR